MNLGAQTGRMVELEPISGVPEVVETPLTSAQVASAQRITDVETGEVLKDRDRPLEVPAR